jgi:hypothetical protein
MEFQIFAATMHSLVIIAILLLVVSGAFALFCKFCPESSVQSEPVTFYEAIKIICHFRSNLFLTKTFLIVESLRVEERSKGLEISIQIF